MPIPTEALAANRLFLHSVTWQTFERLLTELGENRGYRLAYCDGVLEIMTPLGEHEHNNRFIEALIALMADEFNLNIKRMGSLTLKKDGLKQAVEPDSCYYLANEPIIRHKQNINLNSDPPPDLVLEIDISSGSLDKLPIYAALSVPEIWRYDGNKLEIFLLDRATLVYNKSDNSLNFPRFNVKEIPRFIRQSLDAGETTTLKNFRERLRSFQ